MKKQIYKSIAFIIAIFTAFFSIYVPVNAAEQETFKGKNISFLGDSISTFTNYSNNLAASTTNTTIKSYLSHYNNGKYGMSVNDTWWKKSSDILQTNILVNNACSGSKIFYPGSDTLTQGYITRCLNLHDNTGSNAGQKPDIIAVYLGTNDFTHHKDNLGTSNIDYTSLIVKTSTGYNYKKPKTTCEAYAIMLHKTKTLYPNAEIYCFTVLPRAGLNAEETILLENFNEDLKEISTYNNCFIVDLYSDSGITANKDNLNRYIGDSLLHPNKFGMNAISNVFLTSLYKNSKYLPYYEKVYDVNYYLDDSVIVNEGLKKATLGHESFTCTFSKLSYGKLNVQVKMNNEDITDSCYKDSEIHIPSVNGNIEISAYVDTVERIFHSYRFELNQDNSELTNIITNENETNPISFITGTIPDSYINSGEFILRENANLYYDKPWDVVWHTKYTDNNTPVIFSREETAKTEGNTVIHIQEGTSILALGLYKNGDFHNFGIDLSEHNIDIKDEHTYKLSNIYNRDGTNTVILFVDGIKIGELNNYYINDSYKGSKGSLFFETDLSFKYIGTQDNLINNCNLEYIQIWENSASSNHIHRYKHLSKQSATCSIPEITTEYCDCGNLRETETKPALGHKPSDWNVALAATVHKDGLKQKKCTLCGIITTTEKIPQKKCSAPKLVSAKNTSSGVLFTWKKTSGADKYRIYRKEQSKGWVYLASVGASYNSYTDKSAKSGKNYYYTVKAVNEAGYSGYNSGVFTRFLSAPKLKEIKNTGKAIKIKWSRVTGAKYYKIYRKLGKNEWDYIGKTDSLCFYDNKVSSGKIYTYTVKAAYGKYYSSHNKTGIKTKRLITPKLKSATSTKSGVTLKWSKTSYNSGYIVYRKSGKNDFTRIAVVKNPDTLHFLDKSAKKGVTYTYTVKAYSGSYYSSYYSGIKIKDKY